MEFTGKVTTVQKKDTENDKGSKEEWKVTVQGNLTKAVITSESQQNYHIGEDVTLTVKSSQTKLAE